MQRHHLRYECAFGARIAHVRERQVALRNGHWSRPSREIRPICAVRRP
jgi:hypothetical protein